MARTALIASVAATMVLAASPLASATSTEVVPQAQTVQQQIPAMNANMLSMNMCSERTTIVSELEKNFQESVQAVGMVDQSAMVEIFVSEDTGSWTILATGTDGNSCIISAGEGWESLQLVRGTDA